MNFSNEAIGSGSDGAIFNFYGELPMWMNHDEVSAAYAELDASVRGIKDPPVASINPPFFEDADIEDYRRFYVEFEESATGEDIAAAVHLVANAIKRFRHAN